jgi:hypothetical protein
VGQALWPAKSLSPQEAGESACPTRGQNYAALVFSSSETRAAASPIMASF